MNLFLIIILSCLAWLPIQTTSLERAYSMALGYAMAGNYNGFKTIVSKFNLQIDKPAAFNKPLMNLTVYSCGDIQSSKAMIEFIKQRGVDLTAKNESNSTILHTAAYAKNIAALQILLKEPNVKTILYSQNKEGKTVLSCADTRIDNCTDTSRIATIATLKQNGYKLSQDPLYHAYKLSHGLITLWYDSELLKYAIAEEQLKENKQQILKKEIREIVYKAAANDIAVVINNSVGIACAARYDEIKTIEINPRFEAIPYKKPIILHELAHHLLGHVYNHNDLEEHKFTYEQLLKREDDADDFAIKECPEEFIKVCQYCIDNNFKPGIRSYEQRKQRAERYFKNID